MRFLTLTSLAVTLCCACAAPGPVASEPAQAVNAWEPAEEREQVERLAARLDLLRVLRSDLDVTVDPDPDHARRTWEVNLREFDQRLLDFVVEHPELHPKSAERLRTSVVTPYRALRRVEGPRGALRRRDEG